MTIKRILAMLLCVLMLGSLSPVGVFAEGDPCAEGHDYKAANVTSPTSVICPSGTAITMRASPSFIKKTHACASGR